MSCNACRARIYGIRRSVSSTSCPRSPIRSRSSSLPSSRWSQASSPRTTRPTRRQAPIRYRCCVMNKAILQVTGLTRSFSQGGETIDVLRGVDLTVGEGEIVALLGPSGSGKSTMLQAVGLLEGGFGGSIRIAGEEASRADAHARTVLRRDYLGFVYQFHHLLPDFTATENVVLPQLIRDRTRAEADDRAAALRTALGLGHRLTHRPSQLSGGEQQRVAVARALANRPALVLADEPTGNLDEATADIVLAELLRLVRHAGSAALIATHNERIAAKMARIVRLHEGRLEKGEGALDRGHR